VVVRSAKAAVTLWQFPRLGVIAKLIERAKGVRCEL
jgi:hypothetical protein